MLPISDDGNNEIAFLLERLIGADRMPDLSLRHHTIAQRPKVHRRPEAVGSGLRRPNAKAPTPRHQRPNEIMIGSSFRALGAAALHLAPAPEVQDSEPTTPCHAQHGQAPTPHNIRATLASCAHLSCCYVPHFGEVMGHAGPSGQGPKACDMSSAVAERC